MVLYFIIMVCVFYLGSFLLYRCFRIEPAIDPGGAGPAEAVDKGQDVPRPAAQEGR